MSLAFLTLACIVVLAFLYTFTGLNGNSGVQNYRTKFTLWKVFSIDVEVNKKKRARRKTSSNFPKHIK
jgi:hypothetical protein